MNALATQFRNPRPSFRGKPFWSWNGALREEELIRQIHVMKEMGLGGFFMHSRTGLITEYLGDEWFRLINACADEAERLGMEAWLYDEDRWPSGTAGGLVTQRPEFQMTFLSLRPIPGAEFQWNPTFYAAFVCDLEGLSYTHCTQISPETPSNEIQDKTVLAFTLDHSDCSSFYNGYTYVDTLNQEATEHYLQLTHEQYREHCGDRLGKSIQGIFTDEPHRGSVMTGFGISNANRLWMTPWTLTLPETFHARFGYDLRPHLPELFLQKDGQAVSQIKWHYMEILQEMFLDNFVNPLYTWCSRNKMRLTGHALHEDSLTCQVAMQGSMMRFYERMHDPGVDVLTEGNRNYVIVKQLTSVARQMGQPWRLSELYGCTGWQFNFESHKASGDWQVLLGINVRCHHLSWYTMEGEAKRDFPGSILHQSAWWKEYDYVETYFARLGLVLSQGKPCCDLLVISPVESVWCQIHAGWAEGMSPQTPEIHRLEQAYSELAQWLLGAHLDFDYGDEEMLGRLAFVQPSKDNMPKIRVGEAEYRGIVVGRMTTMRASTVRLLDAFRQAGGTVIFTGDPPDYVEAQPSDEAHAMAASVTQVPWDRASITAACRAATVEPVEIIDSLSGQTIDQIFCQLRMDGSHRILAAINIDLSADFPNVSIKLPGTGAIEEWDCRTGDRWAIAAHSQDGTTEFVTSFAPSGERVFVLTPQSDSNLTTRTISTSTKQQSCSGPFDYTLSEDNVCVLDLAWFRVGDGAWQPPTEILKADQAVRRTLGWEIRSGEMVQPWYRAKYQPSTREGAPVILQFEFAVESLPTDTVFLAVEQPKEWKIALNNVPLPMEVQGWWVDTAFAKIAIPATTLRRGPNTLTLETDFREDINLEAVYLLGAFGVALYGTRPTLTSLPEQLLVGDLTTQGLPFYGGAVTYQIPLPFTPTPDQLLHVLTPGFEAASLTVGLDTEKHQIIAWPPYEASLTVGPSSGETLRLTTILTRRNTFGPLHQIPLRAGAYGPGNFVTEGESFSEAYQLYPAGLLQPPLICW